MALSVLGLFLFIIVVVIVVLAGVSLWKSKGLAAVFIIAGVLLVLGLAFISLLSVRMEPAPPIIMSAEMPNGQGSVLIQSGPSDVITEIAPLDAALPPQPAGIPTSEFAAITSPGNPSWMETDEDVFAIQHFPSVESSIAPLVQETMVKVSVGQASSSNAQSDEASEKRVYVWVKGADSKAFENEVVELVRSSLEGWDVQVTNDVQLKSLTLDVELQLKGGYLHIAAWDKDAIIQKGSVRCTAHTPEGKTYTTLKQFDAKPWVHSFDQFVTNYPRRRFMVGYSAGVHSSEDEARRAAMDDVRVKSEPEYGPLSEMLATEPNVVDRFAQKLERPYGVVWREAVLVEVTSNALRNAQARMPGRGDSTHGRLWLVFSLAIVASIAVLLCSLLNWITEGYYRGRWLALGLSGVLISTFLLVISTTGF
ncbi:MAG: hypothetical protein AAFU85_04790 [Planctomycetota bacterium]